MEFRGSVAQAALELILPLLLASESWDYRCGFHPAFGLFFTEPSEVRDSLSLKRWLLHHRGLSEG